EFDKNSSIKTTKSTKEVEAESTAFVVCEHYGIDTKDYSFPYLAAWSSDKELKELKNSFEVILKQADNLIQKIDKNLAELQKEVTKEKEEKQSTLSLSDQLEEFDDKAKSLNEQREKEKLINKIRQSKEQKDVSTL
ncbi:hypothetical protein FFQ47_002281, partial [Enterococcus faecium]|nr:hypothetical protein [Enterococcus faecium]